MWACGVILILFLPLSVFLSLFSVSLSLSLFLLMLRNSRQETGKQGSCDGMLSLHFGLSCKHCYRLVLCCNSPPTGWKLLQQMVKSPVLSLFCSIKKEKKNQLPCFAQGCARGRVSEVVLLHTTPKQGCRPCNQAVLCRPHSLNQSIFSILWVLC